MINKLLTLGLWCMPWFIFAQTVHTKYKNNETVTLQECIDYYHTLDSAHNNVSMMQVGRSDMNVPIYCVLISEQPIFNYSKPTMLVNNGIHPGEPCGVDACMSWAQYLLESAEGKNILKSVNVVIIPIYNVEGALNRNSHSRANQNGPKEYGFRGTATNRDLNRDFMKCDTKITEAFYKVFHMFNPLVFVDTHISDGADYTYTMTLIGTQSKKLHPSLATYMDTVMVPYLYRDMEAKHNPMFPYVETISDTPDSGIAGFNDIPRFSTGYASLFNCISFVTETHMLKPYALQVEATIDFLKTLSTFMATNGNSLASIRAKADRATSEQKFVGINWQQTNKVTDSLLFNGYAAEKRTSNVTGLPFVFYNHQLPITKYIPYYNTFSVTDSIALPRAYIVPQQWYRVIELLKLNKVEMMELLNDSLMKVQCYYIEDYQTGQRPYEGHYLHSKVRVRSEHQSILIRKGDVVVFCNQSCNKYLGNLLEPTAVDGLFAWNYFDAILQQKEWFSDYLFENIAYEMLQKDVVLKQKFHDYVKEKKIEKDAWAQLLWLYNQSPYKEKSHNRFPVFRVNY